jgi:hydrogenase maturation protease
MSSRVVVIGIGNRFRRDDAFGPQVLDRVAPHLPQDASAQESDGEPGRLIDVWAGAELAVVIEAVRRGSAAGTISDIVVDGGVEDWPRQDTTEYGSHSLGIAHAIALGRAVGRLPRRLRIVGVEPADLGYGDGLSDPVQASVDRAARLVLDCVRAEGVA